MRFQSKFKSKFSFALLNKLITLGSGSLLLYILTRILQPDGFGIFQLFLTIFGVFQLISKFGIPNSAARYVSKYKEEDQSKLSEVIYYSLLINIVSILSVCIFVYMFWGHIINYMEYPELKNFLIGGILFVVFSSLHSYITILTQGLEKIRVSSLLGIVSSIVKTIASTVFVFLGFGVIGAISGYLISFIVSSVIGFAYLSYYGFKNDLYNLDDSDSAIGRKILRYSVPLASTSAAHTMDDRIDTLLIAFYLGPAAVGFYVLSKRIVSVIQAPVSALGFTISPSYESTRVNKGEESSARIYEKALSDVMLLYVPAALGLFVVSPHVIEYIFGNAYLDAAPVLRILSFYIVLQAITNITSSGLDYMGSAKERAVSLWVSAILNIGLNIYLIPRMNIEGAAIATGISYSIYTFSNIYFIHSKLNIEMSRILLVTVRSIFIAIVVVSPVYLYSHVIVNLVTLLIFVLGSVAFWFVIVYRLDLIEQDLFEE